MSTATPIDITFDFRSDTPPGKDPDTWSPSLCAAHQFLRSKPLPNGRTFDLVAKPNPPFYLIHQSELGRFVLSSDTVMPTFRKHPNVKEIFTQIPAECRNFGGLGYTIGGMMLFPAHQVNRKWTVNQARGCHPKIKDRFDLTLECIRRQYAGQASPLQSCLERYAAFFALFENFKAYTEFFLLQDMVSEDFSQVKFFMPFDGFLSSPVPESREAYLHYREQAISFLHARNKRIKAWATAMLHDPHRTC